MKNRISFFVAILLSTNALASVDSVPGMNAKQDTSYTSSLPPETIYDRTQSVLIHFGVPSESQPSIADLQKTQKYSSALPLLKYLDPSSQWNRFNSMDQDDFSAFLDRDAKSISDYRIRFAAENENPVSVDGLSERLHKLASHLNGSKPLAGLRVALDPGHMGPGEIDNTNWDEMTGKYVVDSHGNKMSEGVINLQTSLLLEQQLKDLGAEVMITHRELEPVTQLPYHQLSLQDYGNAALRKAWPLAWFQALLETAPAGTELYSSFQEDKNFKSLYSEKERSQYFILEADLDARADLIAKFKPDITLIIHYDVDVTAAEPHGVNPNGRDMVKTYLPGAYAPEEFATRGDRAYLVRHLMDPESWKASLGLSHSIVQHIHQSLGVEPEEPLGTDVVKIEPGVLARNLALTKKVSGHAISYVECLYYNSGREFDVLRKADHTIEIGGKSYPYSDRLAQVATALKNSIVDFLKTYQ